MSDVAHGALQWRAEVHQLRATVADLVAQLEERTTNEAANEAAAKLSYESIMQAALEAVCSCPLSAKYENC
jgi:hypothetical protein